AARAPAPVVELAPKRSHGLKIAAGVAVLFGIGGASLTLVPALGPFGIHFIVDRLNVQTNAAAFANLQVALPSDLGEDTSASAARALDRAKQARSAIVRHRPTMAYAAYVAFSRGIRFGKRNDDEAYGRQVLAEAGPEPSQAHALARAADDALSGKL